MASDATPIPKSILTTPRCLIRPYHASDICAVAHYANNPNVARNLRPHFPSPYTLDDAEELVSRCCAEEKPLSLYFYSLIPDLLSPATTDTPPARSANPN
jgi:hypothetical protein